MKSRSDIWLCALEELGALCSVDTRRDAQTVTSRVGREGDTFLKVALPRFAKDFETSLRLGYIPRDAFKGFKRRAFWIFYEGPDESYFDKTIGTHLDGSPRFLGGFLDLVFTSAGTTSELFDPKGEVEGSVHVTDFLPTLREEVGPNAADAVAAIRQLCLMFGKEKERCAPSIVDAAYETFVETDQGLDNPLKDSRADLLFEGGLLADLRRVTGVMFGSSLVKIGHMIDNHELLPRHGPGATADYRYGNQKWRADSWTDRLETLFPYLEYALPNYRFWKSLDRVEFLSQQDELPVRLVDVPKTHTTPRLIAIEPTCMQYVQQAISIPLRELIESDKISGEIVQFSDQRLNQAMAHCGSDDGSVATLDLSEASDRVANWLVEEMFENFPIFLEGIQACRSTHAKLPSGEVIPLLKFASMGSALTFPIEAMAFSAIAILACIRAEQLPISERSIMAFHGRVCVYGDDIIVPSDYAETVVSFLELFGFRVNYAKSFWTGQFRESCGKEYWNGYDVSIVRFRKGIPSSLHDVDEIISTVSTRNLLAKAGLTKTVAMLDTLLEKILIYFPYVSETSPILGRHHPAGFYQVDRLHGSLHSPQTRGWIVKSPIPENRIDDKEALLKCLIGVIGKPDIDDEHLTRSGRPRAVSIKLVKASPF